MQNEIEQMAKAVCHLDRTCDECMTSFECKAMMYAKRFYEAGYRKTSDIASEIFEEIDRMCIDTFGNFNHRVFAELKKKYTQEK
jgi:hypothetical protein